jgi:hypothetical protein
MRLLDLFLITRLTFRRSMRTDEYKESSTFDKAIGGPESHMRAWVFLKLAPSAITRLDTAVAGECLDIHTSSNR